MSCWCSLSDPLKNVAFIYRRCTIDSHAFLLMTMNSARLSLVFAASFLALPLSAKTPSVELLGVARIDGNTSDGSGLTEKLEDGSSANQFGGLSAIDYTGVGDRFVLLSDRGAGDGAVSFPCRYHEAELVLVPENKEVRFVLSATHLFQSEDGQQLVGSLAAHGKDLINGRSDPQWTAFDPEGIRFLGNGQLLVSDEYGPRVVIAETDGRITSQYDVPIEFHLQLPRDGLYTAGLYPNRGFEGIAITPSGKKSIAVLQSPLVQDGVLKDGKCLGMNSRWLVFDRLGKPIKQIVYRLESVDTGVSEILAIDESRFLVLERDSNSGLEANVKKMFLAEIEDATDVSGMASLPEQAAPCHVVVASKTLVIDLLEDRFGLGGELAAEKPEGICWGKDLSDGRKTLWVCCDNDFDSSRKSEIYCFAVGGL